MATDNFMLSVDLGEWRKNAMAIVLYKHGGDTPEAFQRCYEVFSELQYEIYRNYGDVSFESLCQMIYDS